jgi:hypothetical protein
MNRLTLILDAMGVIYRSADDVEELLIPFVAAHGGTQDREYDRVKNLDAARTLGFRTVLL